MRYVILFGGGLSYLFWLQVVLIRTQPEKTCPTKNVVFIGVSGFVVLMQSYHLQRDLRTDLLTDRLSTEIRRN